MCVQSHHVAAARMYDQLQLWYAAKHMECLHDILLTNHAQIICVHAQCDFRNTDDGILQQVSDNYEQGNVSPGISSANEQRWFDYSVKIVTQSDCSDRMLSMMTIVSIYVQARTALVNTYWLAGNSSIGLQRRCDQERGDENSICVHAHRQWWMLII